MRPSSRVVVTARVRRAGCTEFDTFCRGRCSSSCQRVTLAAFGRGVAGQGFTERNGATVRVVGYLDAGSVSMLASAIAGAAAALVMFFKAGFGKVFGRLSPKRRRAAAAAQAAATDQP